MQQQMNKQEMDTCNQGWGTLIPDDTGTAGGFKPGQELGFAFTT